MKFLDEIVLTIQAGHGGAGAKHFRREKFVAFGGPDGGNGGRGGDVIFRGNPGKLTLIDFHYTPLIRAKNGAAGQGANKDGAAGEDVILDVPLGTEVINEDTGNLVADIVEDGAPVIIAKGGRGGKGNSFFKSSTNQAPEHFQPGEPGLEFRARLSLKLIAHVGLIGFPNAGKSTLISRISEAKPKIADYPFTTLVPHLGVVRAKGGKSFVVADIPGLIPGASLGKGLGLAFLKHVERTSVLAHLLDASTEESMYGESAYGDKTLIERFDLINHELKNFSLELATRQQIAVFTKLDAVQNTSFLEDAAKALSERGVTCFKISSATGQGVQELTDFLAETISGSNLNRLI